MIILILRRLEFGEDIDDKDDVDDKQDDIAFCGDDDDDDDVTFEEVRARGRTGTNAPSQSLTAADWLKRALSALIVMMMSMSMMMIVMIKMLMSKRALSDHIMAMMMIRTKTR